MNKYIKIFLIVVVIIVALFLLLKKDRSLSNNEDVSHLQTTSTVTQTSTVIDPSLPEAEQVKKALPPEFPFPASASIEQIKIQSVGQNKKSYALVYFEPGTPDALMQKYISLFEKDGYETTSSSKGNDYIFTGTKGPTASSGMNMTFTESKNGSGARIVVIVSP